MYKELILELTQNNEYVKIQSPCTGEEIEKAEKAVGYPFPKELWELLYELDGDKYLLLSAKEIIAQAILNRETQEMYSDEEFAKELDKFIFLLQTAAGTIIAIMQTLTELLMKTLSTFGNTKCFVGNK